jgi:hypothetical protein
MLANTTCMHAGNYACDMYVRLGEALKVHTPDSHMRHT